MHGHLLINVVIYVLLLYVFANLYMTLSQSNSKLHVLKPAFGDLGISGYIKRGSGVQNNDGSSSSIAICSQDARKRMVDAMCQRNTSYQRDYHGMSESELRELVQSMLVDEQHKLVYCEVQKAGCRTWKRLFIYNNHLKLNLPVPNIVDPNDEIVHRRAYLRNVSIYEMKNLSRDAIVERLDNYYKLAVVRHPVVKLLSAFKDKLTGANRYYDTFVAYLKKSVRLNQTKTLPFGDFLQYFVENQMKHDPHFTSLESHCHPCVVHYDYIARTETADVDKEYIIKNKLSGFGAENVHNKHGNDVGFSLNAVLPQFSNVTPLVRHKLTKLMSRDMALFGYNFHCDDDDSGCMARCGTPNTCC